MPDAVRMWGVVEKGNHAHAFEAHADRSVAVSKQDEYDCLCETEVIPGTFTPDEEGSDEQE